LAELKAALTKAKSHGAPFLIELDESALDCGYAF
jgi:acetolactate synthase-1/2/3 large subunit